MKSLQNDAGTRGEHRSLVTQNWHKDVRGLSGSGPLIAICVCTCQRPQMLADCLASLLKLYPIPGVQTQIIVVDNEACGTPLVEETARVFGAHYRHQPDRGIPQARNAALDAAREIGANHLAFIDDDETADPAWLLALWETMHGYGADAVQGYCRYSYPMGTPDWRKRGEYNGKRQATGKHLEVAQTGNVLFSLDAARGLRFDESLRFLGGEDSIYFDQFRKRGGLIIFCDQAVVYEHVQPERITFRGNIKKAFRKGFCEVYENRLMGKRHKVTAFKFGKRFTLGFMKVAVSPICIIGGPGFMLHAMLSGSRQIAFCAGAASALLGRKSFDYYRHPVGY
jgi:succinoglycan biosynthesis protein ExoM